MSSSTCTLCFLVSMVVMFLSFSPSKSLDHRPDRYDPATQSRINHVCILSYDYNLCHEIINKDLHGDIIDFKGLTQISLSETLQYTTETFIFIKKAERDERDKTRQGLYKICDEGYGILVNQFQEASLAFAKNDIKSVLFDIGNTERFINDCENVLGSQVPALHDMNVHAKVLVKMSNVSGGLIGQDLA